MTLLSLLLPWFIYLLNLFIKMITYSNSDLAVPLNSEE